MKTTREYTSNLTINRRTMLQASVAGLASGAWAAPWPAEATAADRATKLRIGSCRLGLADARKAGLDGVEIGVGGAADTLQVADPAVRQRYKDEMKQTGLDISSLMMGLLNGNPLASDPRAPAWLEQSIDAAKDQAGS